MTTSCDEQLPSLTCRPAELALIFLRLGATAFGGPAAHIAMMRAEFVQRRKLITEEEFLDLLGAANILPGPSSTEVGIFIGFRLCGWIGLVLAGVCFIVPAMLIVSVFAWGYVKYGHLPEVAGVLYGIKPVIIVVIAQAIWGLGRTAFKSPETIIVSAVGLALCFLGVLPLFLLFFSGVTLSARQWFGSRDQVSSKPDRLVVGSIALIFLVPLLLTLLGPLEPSRLTNVSLFLVFAKIGTMVFGSGYVLLAFLRTEIVTHLHWLTNSQILDAVAVGQFTPGPVFTTATFIGYLLKGPVGAITATVGIFLPAFIFVAATGKVVQRIRTSKITGAFLDGVNCGAVALMTFAGCQLAVGALTDLYTVVIAIGSAAVLFKFRINSAFVVLAGATVGLIIKH